MMYVAGLDECGTGALAGPIVACCVAVEAPVGGVEQLKSWWPIKGVTDSKKLTEASRNKLQVLLIDYIIDNCGEIGIGEADHSEIDTFGHESAWRLAMQRAFAAMHASRKIDRLITDGDRPVGISGVIEMAFPKADKNFFHVAAASIIGKVHRDKLMVQLDKQFPGYDLASSKGYPTGSHIWAVDRYGLTPEHRAKPCATVLRKWRLNSGGVPKSRPPA